MNDLTPIFQAVRYAAQLCQVVQQRHVISNEKGGNEPVTIADYGSQAILCRALQQYFPYDAVMSEESSKQFHILLAPEQRAEIVALIEEVLGIETDEGEVAGWLDHGSDTETDCMWVIDPIDGTKGFLAREHYTVVVGMMQERQPVGAVIAAPEYPGGGRLLFAQDGCAYIQSLYGSDRPRRMHVSERSDLFGIRMVESPSKSEPALERLAQVRRAAGIQGAQIAHADGQEKYSRIAAGDAEVYLRLPRRGSTRPHRIWDHAPGAALVEAAGGKVTDVDGSPLDYSSGTTLNNEGVIATNGLIHGRMVEAVQCVLVTEENV